MSLQYDPRYISLLSQSLNASSAQEQRLTSELSSGLRVSQLSDDPVAASSNVQLASSISMIDSFVSNASSDSSVLQVSDSALGEVVSQVTSAISLAVSAGSSTLSSADLTVIQKQVEDIRDSVVSLANTSYQGSYVFGGSAGAAKPFTLDSSSTPATVTYLGDSVVRTATTPDGQAVPLNVPGKAIFSASGADLLGTLNQLVADLGSGDKTAVTNDSSSLTTALGNVSQQRSVIDTSLSRLSTASTYAGTQEAQLKAQQSTLLSADPAQVATDLSTAETQHQAILGVIASVGQKNLFDYLQ